MFLNAEQLEELTGYRRFRKQREVLDRNAVPYFLAASGRPVVKRSDLPGAESPPKPVDYVYATGPWYAEGITIHEWKERNWESLYVPAVELWLRRVPREQVTTTDPGVYFLYADDGDLLYVGLSALICDRLTTHRKQQVIPFTHASSITMHRRLLAEIEAAYIHNLMPAFNVKGMPEAACEL